MKLVRMERPSASASPPARPSSGDHDSHAPASWWVRAIRHRVVHFLVVGAMIFAVTPRPDDGRDIAFDGATFAALEAAQAARVGGPTLSAGDAGDIRTRAIEDEVLYREALRLGFDRNDNVVRQRLIQKVLFLAEDLAGVSRPASEDDLRAFFETNRAQFTRPARVRLIHVYAGSARRDWLAGLRDAAVRAEAAVPGVPPPLGDAFALPRTVDLPRDDLASQYGEELAAMITVLPLGTWSEPVPSKFGWHLVKVLERDEGGPASYDDVRGKLPLLYLVARKQAAAREFIAKAATRYRVTVDRTPIAVVPSRDRLAEPRRKEPD